MICGIASLPCFVVALFTDETVLAVTFACTAVIYSAVGHYGYKHCDSSSAKVETRISYLSTIFTWMVLILIGAIPYAVADNDLSVMDAIFQSCSAWTTTGAAVTFPSLFPNALRLWAGLCTWMGGIGIVILTLVFLPNWHQIREKMAGAELTAPDFVKKHMNFRQFFRRMLSIYVSISILQCIALICFGMPVFDAVIISLNVVATSGLEGFGQATILAWSTPIKVVITLATLATSLNVVVIIMILKRRWSDLIANIEMRVYLLRILISALVIAFILLNTGNINNIFSSLGSILMQVISFFSTSGYIISDCSGWPAACLAIIMIQIFVGACAGSTGSGIKNVRTIIAVKTAMYSVFQALHPQSVKVIRIGKNTVPNQMAVRSNIFIMLFLLTFLGGTLMLSVVDMDFTEAIGTAATMLANTSVSPLHIAENGVYIGYSAYTKLVMCFLMLCGRLEIYPVLMIFTRAFWIRNKKL